MCFHKHVHYLHTKDRIWKCFTEPKAEQEVKLKFSESATTKLCKKLWLSHEYKAYGQLYNAPLG